MQRIGQASIVSSGVIPQIATVGARGSSVLPGDLTYSRARADSLMSCSEAVQSSHHEEVGRDVPECERDDATPVLFLNYDVPAGNCMIPGMPPLRLLNSFAVSCETLTCVFRHVLGLPRG